MWIYQEKIANRQQRLNSQAAQSLYFLPGKEVDWNYADSWRTVIWFVLLCSEENPGSGYCSTKDPLTAGINRNLIREQISSKGCNIELFCQSRGDPSVWAWGPHVHGNAVRYIPLLLSLCLFCGWEVALVLRAVSWESFLSSTFILRSKITGLMCALSLDEVINVVSSILFIKFMAVLNWYHVLPPQILLY